MFRAGVDAEMFHRFKLGRTLDEAYACGGALLFQELALAVCAHEGSDLRFTHRDTTSCALSGESIPERAEQAMPITDGSAKDHRPAGQQAVLAWIVSQDGGVPCVSKSWAGNTSDIQVLQERTQGWMTALPDAPSPRYVIADAKRSHEAPAPNRPALGFMTRLPHTIGVVSQALPGARWHWLDETTRDPGGELGHDGMAQRWLVVFSQAALERAEATVTTARQRADATIAKQRFHVPAQRCSTPEAAQQALATWAKAWKYPPLEASRLLEHQRDAGTGRPTPHTPLKALAWPSDRPVRPNAEAMRPRISVNAGCGRGTKISARAVSDPEVMAAYTGQARVEGGCRCLNDPLVFVASWLVTKPCRMEA